MVEFCYINLINFTQVLALPFQSGSLSPQLHPVDCVTFAVAVPLHYDLRATGDAGLRREVQLRSCGGEGSAQLRLLLAGASDCLSGKITTLVKYLSTN